MEDKQNPQINENQYLQSTNNLKITRVTYTKGGQEIKRIQNVDSHPQQLKNSTVQMYPSQHYQQFYDRDIPTYNPIQLEGLKKENQILKNQIQELRAKEQEIIDLKNEQNNLKENFLKITKQKDEYFADLTVILHENQKLEDQLKISKENLNIFEKQKVESMKEIEEKSNLMILSQEETKNLLQTIELKEQEIIKLKQNLEHFQQNKETENIKNEQLLEENEKLKLKIQQEKELQNQESQKINNIIVKLNQEFESQLNEINESKMIIIQDLENKIRKYDVMIDQLEGEMEEQRLTQIQLHKALQDKDIHLIEIQDLLNQQQTENQTLLNQINFLEEQIEENKKQQDQCEQGNQMQIELLEQYKEGYETLQEDLKLASQHLSSQQEENQQIKLEKYLISFKMISAMSELERIKNCYNFEQQIFIYNREI